MNSETVTWVPSVTLDPLSVFLTAMMYMVPSVEP